MRQLILLCLILFSIIPVHAQALQSEFVRARMLAWHPSGERLAVGTDNGIHLLNTQFTATAYLNTGSVYAMAWSHDGRYLAVASKTGETCSLEIWQPESLKNIWSAPSCEIYSLDWSTTDDWLAFQDTMEQLYIIHVDSLEAINMVAMNVRNYEWHPQNNWLAFTTQEQTIAVYDVSLRDIVWENDQAVEYVTWSPAGNHLAAIISAGSKTLNLLNEAGAYSMPWPQWHGIHVWNLQSGGLENSLEITDNATRLGRLHWIADGRIGSYYDKVRNEIFIEDVVETWDLNTGHRSSYDLGGGSSRGGTVTWSPDLTMVAAETIWQGCTTNIFHLVSPASQEQMRITGCGAAWTPDSRYVTTITEQGLQHYDVLTDTAVEYVLPESGLQTIHESN